MIPNRKFDTEELQVKDRQFVHPWEDFSAAGTQNRTVIAESEGIYVYDSNGNKLIDGIAGMWCVNVAYGAEEIAKAMYDQALLMPYYTPWGSTNPPAAELAAKLAELAPGDLDHAFMTTCGSTAVDSALRFALFRNNYLGRPEKRHIISRDDAYHGSTYLGASCSGKERDKNYMDFATHIVHHLSSPNSYRRPDGMSLDDFRYLKVKELEDKILELGPDRTAAFIAEPIQASGGVVMAPAGYHKACLEVCRRHDVLYISDEVVTGFGRLGHFFASETEFDIVPDLITCAKGLSSAYIPIGAVMISSRVLEPISGEKAKGAMFSNGFTYSGHPVACAASLKNIEIMERPGFMDHVLDVGPYFQQRLAELKDIPIVGDVRGHGLMACVECVISQQGKDPLALDYEVGNRIDKHCQEMGLLVRPMINMCVMSPPLTITREQIDDMVRILRQGIERTMADVRKEGVWNG